MKNYNNGIDMISYIIMIKKKLRDIYKIKPTGGTIFEPTFTNVPDGEYPMHINGRLDKVIIKNNSIDCCNFQ